MNPSRFRRTRVACFFTYPAMAPVFILPPILFYTFRQMYGISYTLLGTLVLVNFSIQMGIDLVFTFFSDRFNLHKAIRSMPLLTAAGLIIYAVIPTLLPQYAYGGLLLGTFLFSVSSGLCEVLLSPTVAALPSDNPERDMSVLHSLYGYGSAAIALVSTGFLWLFGTENWMWLTLLMATMSIVAYLLYRVSPLPDIQINHAVSAQAAKRKRTGLAICAACLFLGSAAENTMTNWISVFMESALQMPKMLGDTLGLASFTLLLAFTRTWYARHGKNIFSVLLIGMAGAIACYITAGLTSDKIVAIAACMLTGVCTSMLWPGTLILMEEKFPNPGVAAYALMAASGDCGAAVASQGLGALVDTVSAQAWTAELGAKLSLSAEQVGMKAGMLLGALFPIAGVAVLLYAKRFFRISKEEAL